MYEDEEALDEDKEPDEALDRGWRASCGVDACCGIGSDVGCGNDSWYFC